MTGVPREPTRVLLPKHYDLRHTFNYFDCQRKKHCVFIYTEQLAHCLQKRGEGEKESTLAPKPPGITQGQQGDGS